MISVAAGLRIAGYRLEERIGQGGMAVVFKAHDERLDRPVALKILAPTLTGNAEFQRRFISESRAAATIDDPHIVPVFAAGEADGMLFIAMRYVAGGDAQSMLNREGPLPPDRVAAIISPVASALDAAHRAGLVHRDVKPSNMLMDVLPGRPVHVYLSDFGLSKAVASTSGMTAPGTVLGTLAYMSPERVGAQPVDGRADQYALACSAFELLAGAPPFQRDEPAALIYAHLSVPPPRLTSRRPDLAPAVDDVLSRALAKAPGDRYASCGQFADALRGAFGLQSYRSGPQAMPAGIQTHQPTEIVWPETPAAGQHGGRAAGEAAAPSPFPDTVDAPPPVNTTATPDAIVDAGRLHVGGNSGQARHRRRLRRRIMVAAGIAAAAVLAAGLLLLPGTPAPATTAPVPISLKSALPAVTGDVYVIYQDGKYSSAEVSGEIRKAANGEVARLYAQQFPFKNAPTAARSVIVRPAGGVGRYAFQVTPTLATRYRVELFRSGTSPEPFAISDVKTIYVALRVVLPNAQKCSGSVCYDSVAANFEAPPSALGAEMSKKVYVYSGLNLTKTGNAPVPKWLSLGADKSDVVGTEQVSADEFSATVTFSFTRGSDSYDLAWNMCLKDAVAQDGIGLPGHHGCGDPRVLYSAPYLG
jgi:serine/threonine protein kinase